MGNFEEQFRWQSQFADQVVRIIAPYLITVSRPHVDKNENGDFEIVFPRNGTVGCRLRTPDCERFVGDVTFRARSKNGGKTEMTKIVEGYGDFFFYGHVNKQNTIWHWYLLDYTKLRAIFIRRPYLLHKQQIQNRDGTKFIVFNAENEIPEAIIGQSTESPTAATAGDQCQQQYAQAVTG
jgi:hypothetical protein